MRVASSAQCLLLTTERQMEPRLTIQVSSEASVLTILPPILSSHTSLEITLVDRHSIPTVTLTLLYQQLGSFELRGTCSVLAAEVSASRVNRPPRVLAVSRALGWERDES